MYSSYIGASFLPKGENKMDVFLHLEGKTIGIGDTLTGAAKVALDTVDDEEVRELLIVIMDSCIV